jgi:hypothetical protein
MTLLLRQKKYHDVWKLYKYAKDRTETWNIDKIKPENRKSLGIITTQALDAACRCENIGNAKEAFADLKRCYPSYVRHGNSATHLNSDFKR